jgi:type II secretory pathway component PulK
VNRRGFVLITVLWALVLLAAVAGLTLSVARQGFLASQNRIILARAEWSAAGCLELLRQRLPGAPQLRTLDTVRLGSSAWCRAEVTDPASALDPGMLDSATLVALLGDTVRAAALLDWTDADTVPRAAGAERAWYLSRQRVPPRNGPVASVQELSMVRGFEPVSVEWLERNFTVYGSGRLNPNLADATLLAAIPGLGPGVARQLRARRQFGHEARSLDQLALMLSPSERRTMESRWDALTRQLEFSPSHLVVRLEGGVDGYSLLAREMVLLAVLPDRVAVLRREVW